MPTNAYGPDPAPNVHEIDTKDLIEFIGSESWSLPLALSEWIERTMNADAG